MASVARFRIVCPNDIVYLYSMMTARKKTDQFHRWWGALAMMHWRKPWAH